MLRQSTGQGASCLLKSEAGIRMLMLYHFCFSTDQIVEKIVAFS